MHAIRIFFCFLYILVFQNCAVILAFEERYRYSQYTQGPDQRTNGHDFPYWTYLFTPRLHFKGYFKADVSTVNNYETNFDSENYNVHDDQGFNPHGTGAWLVVGSVTQVCYFNGSCVADFTDSIFNGDVKEDNNKTSAKIVDLDTQAQLYSEMWGWRIRIGDHFSADFTTVPLQSIWSKMPSTIGDESLGAIYQSTLTNIRWIKDTSPFVKELRLLMRSENIDSERLSIRFNLDMINKQQYGRIVGSIGLHGIKSPPFVSHGRYLKSQTFLGADAPFMVDDRNQKVNIDFGNSFHINKNGSFNVESSNIYTAVSLDGDSPVTCSSNLFWLGKVNHHLPSWYINFSGIQSFPALGVLSGEEMDIIRNHPLAVLQVEGTWPSISCKKVLLAESPHGIEVHPYSKWSIRKNPPEEAIFDVFVSKFGKPLKNTVVKFELNCTEKTLCYPPLPYPSAAITNGDGIARFVVKTKDPKNPRKHIDGQLYQFIYYVEGHRPNYEQMKRRGFLKFVNSLLTFRVFDHYIPHSPPTWLNDVYPIFLQYANLYPVMTINFVDLANYYDVLKQKKMILMSMKLPMTHPNYMPVTRDLSKSKRNMIIEWLSQDKPLIGKTKDFYTLENLRKNLQTALQIELATIPPYMTALATIKHNRNSDIRNILRTVLVQEMIHMTLVANILNAVGGKPVLHSKNTAPQYPTRLPGGVHPDLVVPIEKLSIGLIRNIFMKIEEPDSGLERHYEFQHTFKFVEKINDPTQVKRHRRSVAPDSTVDYKVLSCLTESFNNHYNKDLSEVPIMQRILGNGLVENRRGFKSRNSLKGTCFEGGHDSECGIRHHNTIGGFYVHILNTLCYLTDCGSNNEIFTGDPSNQVEYVHGSMHGNSFKVTDFSSAVNAIKSIVEQGEGSSLCNPMFWSNGSSSDLSHYYLFHSITEKRQIKVMKNNDIRNNIPSNEGYEEFSEFCGGKYSFKGPKIDFDPNGVWPMIPNPKKSKYTKHSHAYVKAHEFNSVYNKLLKSLEQVFNGHPEELKDSIGLMYSVLIHLKKLVREPVQEGGDPDVGPNAGPYFNFNN